MGSLLSVIAVNAGAAGFLTRLGIPAAPLATGLMVFTPGPDGFVPGWLFLMFFRFFVGVGNAGIYTIDLPLVQEFIPAYKRGWVSALITTLLPGGSTTWARAVHA